MGAPVSLLKGARAFARDFPRDNMPKGYLWNVIDYVPSIIDAELTGRGGWVWASPALGSDAETGILATYPGPTDKLLFQTQAGRLIEVVDDTTIVDRGAIPRSLQNPIYRAGQVIWTDRDGVNVPQLVPVTGAPVAAYSGAPKARFSTLWNNYLVLGNVPGGNEHVVYYSHPTNPLTGATGWDVNSFSGTAAQVTGLAALRSTLIVFHVGSVERIRGSVPPSSTVTSPDLTREPLFTRVGCTEAKTIQYWNENVIFADEHGVHITDGAVIRNLISQGGLSYFWRTVWGNRATVAACVFLDYYQITIRPPSPGKSVTLICDLNKRQWFRFQNVYALSYVTGGGAVGMERIWGGMADNGRVARVSPCYFPVVGTGSIADADGAPVMPEFETPWYRLTDEGRKRMRFMYLSYDVRTSGGLDAFGGAGTYAREEGEALPHAAGPEMLEVGYIRSPQQTTYTVVGTLPATADYRRYRLPVGQFPYGVAFHVRQITASSVNRIFDLAVEAQAAERSRV